MDPKEKNTYDRITNQLVKTGYGESQHHKVAEYVKEGKMEFPLRYTLTFGTDTLNLVPRYAPDENGQGPYQQEVHAVLYKGIDIPPEKIGPVDTLNLESRFQNPPNPELITPENQHEFMLMEHEYRGQINADMKILMEQKPDIFIRFMEKYRPQLDFEASPALVKQQEQLRTDHKIDVLISSYYNLSPLEVYNALRFERAINKDLFRKPKEGEPAEKRPDGKIENIRYNAWVKPKLNEALDENGRIQMQMWTKEWGFNLVRELNLYNFREMQSENLGRNDKIYFMKKGVAATFTNVNATGDRQVRAIADPEVKKVELYKMNGEKILNQKDYLKKQVISEAEQYRNSNKQQHRASTIPSSVQVASTADTKNGQNSNTGEQPPVISKDQEQQKDQPQTGQSTGKSDQKDENKHSNGKQGNRNNNRNKNQQQERKHLNTDRTVSEDATGMRVGR